MRSSLFIDRLSLTISIEPSSHQLFVTNLEELANTGYLLEERNLYSGLLKSYRSAFYLPFDEGHFCTIQVSPRTRGSRFLRLEWNPARARRISRSPMRAIMETLSSSIPSFSPDMVLNANITRIDLSFRLWKIPIDSLLAFSILRKPVSGRYFAPHVQFDRTGRLNSMEIGKPDGDQYLLIYDKNLEQQTRQITGLPQPSSHTQPNPIQTFISTTQTQFELRLRSIGTYRNLTTMPNPFNDYSVVSYVSAEGIRKDHVWQWFVDSCKLRGAQASLSMIENRRQRTQFRDALREGDPPSWWNPEKIWAELPRALGVTFGAV